MSKIRYFNPVKDDKGYTYSVDNLRINFQIDKRQVDTFRNTFFSLARTDILSYPECTSEFKFRNLLKISYDLEAVAILGFSFNGSDFQNDKFKGYLDVNPNKVGSYSQFWADYRNLKYCCECFEIVRCDIAMDIPVKRQLVILEKDNRKYALDAYSLENRTEYLGRRSNIGYVKVYNKTLESKLDVDMTRIEITCEPSAESYLHYFPKVWDISQGGQLTTEWLKLKDTDLAILRMELQLLSAGLDNGLMFFNSMGRKIKQKLKPFLLPESCLVCSSTVVIFELFEILRDTF